MSADKPCAVEGCTRRARRRIAIHCEAHLWRVRVHGDVLAAIPIGELDIRRHGPKPPEPTEREIAYAPTPPEPGRGLLWLV